MPSFNREPIYASNTNLVVADKLQNPLTGNYLDATATVVFTLFDPNGAVVSSLSAIVMDYVANSRGRFVGTIPSTATITPAAADAAPNIYNSRITATKSGIGVGQWNVYREARTRLEV